MKTKITVRRAVLHALARQHSGLPSEGLVLGDDIRLFAHRVAIATAVRGAQVELEIVE